MTDEELKRLVQEGMEAELEEVERILAAIDADPVLRNVQAPPELREKVFSQIREYEEQKRLEQLSEEDREYIRLGKIYRKRRKWNKVAVLIAAAIAVLALGTVSIGEDKNILSYFKKIVSGEEITEIDSDSIEPTVYTEEDKVYEAIEDEYGFKPVKLEYLPQKTAFKEAVSCVDIQGVNMYYETGKEANIIYTIRPNYREASFAVVVEDEKIQEYSMNINDVIVSLTEYKIIESKKSRWSVLWVYKDVQYMLSITDIEQLEVEKIVNSLSFFE